MRLTVQVHFCFSRGCVGFSEFFLLAPPSSFGGALCGGVAPSTFVREVVAWTSLKTFLLAPPSSLGGAPCGGVAPATFVREVVAWTSLKTLRQLL